MPVHKRREKRCSQCKKTMVRHGTRKGKQRWRCKICKITSEFKRSDTKKRNTEKLFTRWVTEMQPLKKIARQLGVHRTTLSRRFKKHWNKKIEIQIHRLKKTGVLILDGLYIHARLAVLVVLEKETSIPVFFHFCSRENFHSWLFVLNVIKQEYGVPDCLVSDGQKGLRKAISWIFPGILHQRCLAHIIRLSLAWLTKNPKTEAGIQLRVLMLHLGKVKTIMDERIWVEALLSWDKRHQQFLKEKSFNPDTKRSWYTHRRLRGVRSLVLRALPNMFHFLRNPLIPSTSNLLEGGINAPMRELLQRHRGLSEEKQKVLICEFLKMRRNRKLATKNAT